MTAPFGIEIKTGLGRTLDINHPSNRYAAVATVLAGLGTLLWRWSSGADDIWGWSFRVAGAVFLAWAIGRELDPDDVLTAGLAALVVIPLMALGAPSLISAAAVLVAARIAVFTTGISPHLTDGIVLIGGAAFLGARPETWPALGVLIMAVATDRYSQPPGPDRTLWFGAAMTIAALVTAIAFADPPEWAQPTIAEWIVLAVTAAAGFLAAANTRSPASRSDFRNLALSETRLRFGRVLAVFALVVGVIYLGGPIVPSLTPVWAALVSITVLHYFRVLRERKASAGQEPA